MSKEFQNLVKCEDLPEARLPEGTSQHRPCKLMELLGLEIASMYDFQHALLEALDEEFFAKLVLSESEP